jgi:CDP-diacylglycerol---glycerol-3-phosphate 3-phosphatidyltransferase
MSNTIHGPLFTIAASAVSTLISPQSFFGALLEGIKLSNSRISLASLYIGTGKPERALIHALRLQLLRQSKLKVAIQLDLHRALRHNNINVSSTSTSSIIYKSSAHHLLELYKPISTDEQEEIEETLNIETETETKSKKTLDINSQKGYSIQLPSRIRIGLTLLPAQRTFLSSLIPPRFTETLGVFHAKAFVFDKHTIILSGANLSEDYFSNRQDRYVLIKCQKGDEASTGVAELANYLHSFIDDIATLPGGHILSSTGKVHVNGSLNKSSSSPPSSSFYESQSPIFMPNEIHPALHVAYKKELKRILDEKSYKGPARLDKHIRLSNSSKGCNDICIITPRMQLGDINVCHDENATLELLNGLDRWTNESCHIATGYFNLTEKYSSAISNKNNKSAITMLIAAPKANGFYGARGISGAVPTAYSELARRFYEKCVQTGRIYNKNNDKDTSQNGQGVSLFEYQRPGWTFHGKGLWLQSPFSMLSLVGSPNFGRRSTERDLEVQFTFATRNERLVQIFSQEQKALWDDNYVSPIGRHIPSINERTGNVWARPERRIEGMTRTHGLWIHPFIAVFGGLF